MPTPLEPRSVGGHEVLLKREDLHELGAFKWRGALPTVEEYRARGADTVVTVSTGNHAAATAWAANRVGLATVVYVPATVSRTKLAHLERLGADVRLAAGDFDEAKDEARLYAHDRGLPFFEDGAEPAQYSGYAAIAEEILDQAPGPPGAVVVPLGNGALFIGVAGVLARRSPGTLRVAVVAKEAPVMALSWAAGAPVECDRCATFADGLAVRVAIPEAVVRVNALTDQMLQVSERALAHAVAAFEAAGIRAEGAAGAALAAVPQLDGVAGPIVLIVTGRNIDGELLARCREQPESFPD